MNHMFAVVVARNLSKQNLKRINSVLTCAYATTDGRGQRWLVCNGGDAHWAENQAREELKKAHLYDLFCGR